MIKLKTDEEIKLIRLASRIAFEVLKTAGKAIEPGITTRELDNLIETEIIKRGAKPAFKGYRGYRHASCLSVNEEIVHGIPSGRVLKEGDIIGVDVGAVAGGYYGDVAETFAAGKISRTAKKLMAAAKECLERGIRMAKRGGRLGDISSAIEQHAKKNGYSVVTDLYGHGVGSELHEDPLVPNFGRPGTGPVLEKGMIFAIEPMLNAGTGRIETLDDGWTVVTADRSLSAHFEHTILITDDRAEILTRV